MGWPKALAGQWPLPASLSFCALQRELNTTLWRCWVCRSYTLVLPFHTYMPCLMFLSHSSPPLLLRYCWFRVGSHSPPVRDEDWLKHSPHPGPPLHWLFTWLWAHPRSCCTNQHQCRPEKILILPKCCFPAVALSWESSGTCCMAPHRQQRAHLGKCWLRGCGFGLQRKAETKVHALHRSYLCLLLISIL